MPEEDALVVLGLGNPFTHVQLKSAYRRLAHDHHPDKGGDAALFARLKVAYDTLNPLAGRTKATEVETTVCGKPLRDLGRGYPLTESAKSCGNCDGKGYRSVQLEESSIECRNCTGPFGWAIGVVPARPQPCRRCNATGKFTVGDRVAGVCYGCQGTGKRMPKRHFMECPTCRGDRFIKLKSKELQHMFCYECKGIGEVKMFNPVLPRGYLK